MVQPRFNFDQRAAVSTAPRIRRPNFFIPGAPKSGTTALAQWLSEHPEIYFSPRKEPHFFNRDGMPAMRSLAEYEALFAGAQDRHKAIGEGSTHYLRSPTAVPAILDYAPDARFVVCLRNPVEMAPALHRECLHQGWETVRSFEAAWRLQSERRRGRAIPPGVEKEPERLLYGECCRLGEQLERLYSLVARKRVLPLLLEDMQADPANQYRRVLAFLGVRDDGRTRFPVVNPGRPPRSVRLARLVRRAAAARQVLGLGGDWGIAAWIRRLNSAPASSPPLDTRTRTELCDWFQDDIRRLSTLLDRDLSHWLA